MTDDSPDDVLDDLFHACSLAAFLEVASQSVRMPDSETTRRLASRLYEDALAEKNRLADADSQTT